MDRLLTLFAIGYAILVVLNAFVQAMRKSQPPAKPIPPAPKKTEVNVEPAPVKPQADVQPLIVTATPSWEKSAAISGVKDDGEVDDYYDDYDDEFYDDEDLKVNKTSYEHDQVVAIARSDLIKVMREAVILSELLREPRCLRPWPRK